MKLESVVQYMDTLLGTAGHPDYRTALNGLQVGRSPDRPVSRIAAAVDASEPVIEEAVARGADLLVVHHGLFWGGLQPVTGRMHRKLATLLGSDLAVYASHLPLDAHPDIGNCILLARALQLDVEGRFGAYEGAPLGWWGRTEPIEREAFGERVAAAVGGPARVLEGGPEIIHSVGVVTGGGGSFAADAAAEGLDALVTGEASHHTYVDALELGVNVYLAGHYATETFGVKALCAQVAERFGLAWEFVDHPSGL